MKIKNFEEKIEIPEGVEVKIEDNIFSVSKDGKTNKKLLHHKKIKLTVEENSIKMQMLKGRKEEKSMIGTFRAHIKNMFKGITEGHIYRLKICSGHFPMNVALKGDKFVVTNFVGEKTPRELLIKEGATVKIEGELVTVEGNDKERVAQTAADIELLTKIKGKDLRIYQDGIYITEKDGKEII
jgi:large subunit ribosomal protein L6